MDIRDNLRQLINDKGLIQSVLAERASLTPAKHSSILRKTRKLDANELFDLCHVLEINPEDLARYPSNNAKASTSANYNGMHTA